MTLFLKKIVLNIIGLPTRLYNFFVLKYKGVVYATYPRISGRIFISGPGKIILGEGVQINSNLFSNPIGGDTRTLFSVFKGATLSIGDYSGFSNIAISCKEKVTIGKHVKIGGGVKIYDSDFHSLNFEDRKNPKTDIPIIKPIELKDGCFIGAHSIILKGVTIGKESIIGAGSLVTKSVPDGEIWGGNPIKFIKKI
ncbi:acyltransferase [Maribacter algarum]|uniref:Acyltransferase n=1 Tax=Maribacter algarum (ex Zhang et al. 2020) TaxID=2578118 RepID=A0A5S3PHN5_9FLAO|nr:acyltransferase [Maribacter algarum]TMM53790.1 acyltransferase [Maribacter algarum]